MSDWRERANKRRDERHTAVPNIRPPSGSKKNTKKWCRGKTGVKHTPVCRNYNELKRSTYATGWRVLVCSSCGKELDNYWPSTWRKMSAPKPDWVTS